MQVLPESYPADRRGLREALVPGFPYALFYRVQGPELDVLAVAHTSRRPVYWIERL